MSLALILAALALGSRLWAIADKSLWLDEALSWQFAKMPISSMLDYVSASDKHPPLYYLFLHFWIDAVGDSEFGLRSLSATAGAATIVLLAIACWRIRGPLLAALVSVFMLLNATQLYFSQEARMYALMGLWSLSASLALGALIKRPSVFRLAIYTGLLLAVVYTHYSGFIVAAAHAAVFAAYGAVALWRNRKPHILIAGAVAFAVTALVYLPWLSNFRQTASLGASDVPEPSFGLVMESLKAALGLARAGDVWLIPVVAFLGLGVVGIARRWRDATTVSLGALALVPLGQLLISIQSRPMFDLRQIVPYAPALVFLLGFGLVEALDLARRAGRYAGLPGAFALLVLAGFLTSFMFRELTTLYGRIPIEDWRSAAADLRDFDGPIYITAPYTLGSFKYYYGNAPNVQPFGFWSPENQPVGQTVMIGISHQRANLVLAALGDNVAIEGYRSYWGILFYEVRIVHHTTLNVDVPLDQAGAGWSVNAYGYIETTSGFSSFTCKCTLDANGDGRADEPFTVVIEYFDAGTAPFQLFGTSSATVLASETLANTDAWRTLNAHVPAGTPVGQTFGLSGGVTLRRLQVTRTQLENVDLFGSYQGGTRWILRADGYIQSADGYSYIDATPSVDPAQDGTADQAVQIDLEYKAGKPIQVFGMTPGQNWQPRALAASHQGTDGDWRTLSVRVPKGLQPRVYVGKGVMLKSVRFTAISP